MDDSSTLENVYVDKAKVQANSVRQSTINFLKQFARAYSYERKLKTTLGNFVAN